MLRGETPFAPFATLRVRLFASPIDKVMNGDLIALTLVLRNTSAEDFRSISVAVPVPFGASYVENTLYYEAVRVDAERFLGDGYEIARLAPDAQSAFIWKLRADEGAEPIRVVPQVLAGERRIVGAEPVEILRVLSLHEETGKERLRAIG